MPRTTSLLHSFIKYGYMTFSMKGKEIRAFVFGPIYEIKIDSLDFYQYGPEREAKLIANRKVRKQDVEEGSSYASDQDIRNLVKSAAMMIFFFSDPGYSTPVPEIECAVLENLGQINLDNLIEIEIEIPAPSGLIEDGSSRFAYPAAYDFKIFKSTDNPKQRNLVVSGKIFLPAR